MIWKDSIVFLCVLFSVISTLSAYSALQGSLNTCDEIRNQWELNTRYDSPVTSTRQISTLDGTFFLSKRCEIYPGPEFVLRKYRIFWKSRTFHLEKYFYDDIDCNKPTYVIEMRGRLNDVKPSWFLNGAFDIEPEVESVSLKTFSRSQQHLWYLRFKEECGFDLKKMKKPLNQWKSSKNSSIHIVSSVEIPTKCWDPLGFSGNEFKRIQFIHRDATNTFELRLATDDEIPISFQSPLVQQAYNDVSRTIGAFNNESLPRLTSTAGFTKSRIPSGNWISVDCESDDILHRIRQLHFDPNTFKWRSVFRYYSDSLCSVPSLDLEASGTFDTRFEYSIHNAALNVNFTVVAAKVTPRSEKSVKTLNADDLCGDTEWEIDVTRDVTMFGGCETLGIEIPARKQDIIVLTGDNHLLTGGPTGEENSRPTGVSEPLIQCEMDSSLEDQIIQNELHPIADYLSNQSHSLSTKNTTFLSNIIIISLLTVIFMRKFL